MASVNRKSFDFSVNYVPYRSRYEEILSKMGNNKLNFVKSGFYQPNEEQSDSIPKPLWKCLLSEFIGTLLLIFIGCGSGIRLGAVGENIEFHQAQPFVGIALCWAFIICSLAQTLGHISCDINPSITIANLVTGRTTILKAISYIIIQCVGCTCGAYLLKLVMPPQFNDNYGMTMISPLITPIQGVFLEIVATFLLVFVVFGANDDGRKDIKGSVPLSIGFTVAGIILAIGQLTGASLNPARTFGPSLVAKNFINHWVYWVGPICGGLLGGVLYQTLYRAPAVEKEGQDPEGENEPAPSSV